jgi:hypothetical protein
VWLAALRSGVFIGRPFGELRPAGWDQVLGIFGPNTSAGLLPQLERRATVALGRFSDDNLTMPW